MRDFVRDAFDPQRERLVLNQVVLVACPQVIFLGKLHGRYWRIGECETNLRILSGNIWRKLGVELSDSYFSNCGGLFF